MPFYVAHSDTNFCGTDNYEVFEVDNDAMAEDALAEIVYDNATQYFTVVSADEYADMEEDENFDDSGYVSEEDIYGEVEVYNPKIHNEVLEQHQIDEIV